MSILVTGKTNSTANMKKLSTAPALLAIILLLFTSCSHRHYTARTDDATIVVLFDNDVHCAVDGYPRVAAYKTQLMQRYDNVCLVSSGDFVQGGSLGAVSKGEYIVRLMNSAGCDAVTLGNHEFDYGMDRLAELSQMLDAPVLACNLYDLRGGDSRLMYEPYKIVSFGKTDVAFIGIATPYSFTSSTPTYFQDGDGNFVFSLCTDNLYEVVQANIDRARSEGADYVIALSHLGDDEAFNEINSLELAARTSGLDVILDGHAHSTIPGRYMKNKDGKEVILTSTGSHFSTVGQLTISPKGDLHVELIPMETLTARDPRTFTLLEDIERAYAERGTRVIGTSETDLWTETEEEGRISRFEETAFGDLCADAIRGVMKADFSFLGGGSIRANIAKGPVTFNDIFSVFPFGNTIATCEMTGQQILDALEFSVSSLPVEFGGFLQVSGLRFEAYLQTDSPVTVNENKAFTGFLEGPRRVRNVMVEKDDGTLLPLDPSGVYTVSGSAYLLKSHGDGYDVLKDVDAVDTGIGDVQVLEQYIVENLGGVIPAKYSEPQGRITLIY